MLQHTPLTKDSPSEYRQYAYKPVKTHLNRQATKGDSQTISKIRKSESNHESSEKCKGKLNTPIPSPERQQGERSQETDTTKSGRGGSHVHTPVRARSGTAAPEDHTAASTKADPASPPEVYAHRETLRSAFFPVVTSGTSETSTHGRTQRDRSICTPEHPPK